MGEKRYLMADVVKKLDVPPYMLRYFEDALAINIPRNERGLRYYRKQEVELFASVINLRNKGFEMSTIRIILDDIHRVEKLPPEKLLELRDRLQGVIEKKQSETDMDILDGSDVSGNGRNSLVHEGKDTTETGRTGNKMVEVMEPGEKTDVEIAGSEREISPDADERMLQFKNIMTGIVLDALKINNDDLGRQIRYNVTDSVVREVGYLMKKQDEASEERYKAIDMKLREVCATSENGKISKKKK